MDFTKKLGTLTYKSLMESKRHIYGFGQANFRVKKSYVIYLEKYILEPAIPSFLLFESPACCRQKSLLYISTTCLSSVTVRKGQGSISRDFENFSGFLFNKIYVGGNHILPVQMTVLSVKGPSDSRIFFDMLDALL